MEISEVKQRNYRDTKNTILEKLSPQAFVSLDGFLKWWLHSGEPISVFMHEMKNILSQVMPELVGGPRNQLFLYQFLSGIPEGISKPICAASEVKSFEQAAVEKATLLMAVDNNNPSAVAAVSDSQASQVQELQGPISTLTEQVAALSTRRQTQFHQTTMLCYSCGGTGHL